MGTVVQASRTAFKIAAPCTRPTPGASRRCKFSLSSRGVRAIRRTGFRALAVSATNSDVSTGIFPAGKKQAKVQLPAVLVIVTSQEALLPDLPQRVEKCISAGATALVVRDSSTGGADLFKATAQLKDVVRGRVAVLLEDRTDIVAATESDGVVLTSQGSTGAPSFQWSSLSPMVIVAAAGVPLTIAKTILSDPSYLIGVCAPSSDAATAAIADGASFIILQTPGDGRDHLPMSIITQTIDGTRSGLQIPLLASAAAVAPPEFGSWVSAGLDGVCGSIADLTTLSQTGAASSDSISNIPATLSVVLSQLSPINTPVSTTSTTSEAVGTTATPSAASGLLSGLLGDKTPLDTLIAREKQCLSETIEFLETAVPDMGETRLLKDALVGLEEPFLLVVVGEFNSGKSTVINALLGAKYLEEGILPTTNEISILKHAESKGRTERTEDGLFVRYLPSELLRRLHVVDTPGTNVIVDRQQRLTEEFVPRSDLVLFIMSSDRPFTESEVKFLRYIKQWGKKVVFVLNKVDILSTPEEVAQVSSFVSEKARLLLGIESATVIPVAARAALEAKVAAGSDVHGGVLQSVDVEEVLGPDERWQNSRFLELERFMLRFLTGGAPGDGAQAGGETEAEKAEDAGESTRLKLQTPLFVADALMQAAERQLDLEKAYCEEEVSAIQSIDSQLDKFAAEMESDGSVQRARVRKLLDAELERSVAAVSSTLQLSNITSLSSYIWGGDSKKSSELPIATALAGPYKGENVREQLEERITEHASWVETNSAAQLAAYVDFVTARVGGDTATAAAITPVDTSDSSTSNSNGASAAEADGATGETDAASEKTEGHMDSFAGNKPLALSLLDPLDVAEVTTDLEGRVKDVVMESTSAAAGTAVVAFILTAILPTTLEDILALCLAGALAYISLLSWPIKRGDIKGALSERYGSLATSIEGELKSELDSGVSKLRTQVNNMVVPLLQTAQEELATVHSRQQRLADLKVRLDEVRGEISRV